jgi:hypothetical protein
MKTARGDLDPWARDWCRCQAAPRTHAHVPGGLALLFPAERTPAEMAAYWARRSMLAAALSVTLAILSIVLVSLAGGH